MMSFPLSFRAVGSISNFWFTVRLLVLMLGCPTLLLAQNPTITSFSPTSGGRGASIVITGTNFTGATAVRFGNAPALSFTVNSATQITAVVGNGATGSIFVTKGVDGQSATFFTFVNAAPTITSISPATQSAGGAVTINGTNFGANVAGNTVFIGGMKANIAAANTNSITCTVPAGAVSGFITVVNLTNERSVRSGQPYRVTHSAGAVAAGTYATRTAISNAGITGPVRIRMADMDNDGKADAIFTRSAGNMAILRNTSNATTPSFANPVDASARTSTHFDVGDMGNDGKLDLIETSGNTTFITRRNTSTSGSLSFATAFSTNIPSSSSIPAYNFRGVEFVDIDQDGMVDMTAAAAYPNTGWFMGKMATYSGNSLFLGGTNAFGNLDHYHVATGDLNADGIADLVSVSSSDFKMVANVNKSTSTAYQLTYNQFATGTSAVDGKILLADLNADGKNDVLARLPGDIRVWRNTTATAGSNTLTFGAGQAFAAAIAGKTNFTIGDLNGDGLPDLVVSTSSATGALQLYINTSTVTDISFAAPISINGVAAADVAVADVNNDNRPDIIATETAGNSLGVYLWTAAVAAPVVSSFTPASGPIGTSITITGSNFTGATAVTIGAGNTPAQSFTVNSATQITATVATGTTTGVLRVSTPAGTTPSATNFTVTAAAPTITNTNPTTGSPGTVVTITGTNFTGATAVTFGIGNTNASSFTVNSATQITATIAAGTSLGNGPVKVVTPVSTATLNGFLFTSNQPTITGIVGPPIMPTWIITGGLLTINGTNFTGATAVTIGTGNTPVTSFSVVSSTQITCRVSGATTVGSGPIKVTGPGGTGTSSNFTIVSGLPAINSFSPTSGSTGTTVAINGTNLNIDNGSPLPTVTIGANNTPATVQGFSGSNLNVTVGAGTNTGPITVTTSYGSVTSSTNFTAGQPAPTVTSISPLSAPAGATITIQGTNLTGATVAVFSNSFNVLSNNGTTMTVQVPSSVISGMMQVSTSSGSAPTTGFFTFQDAGNVLQHRAAQTLTLTGPAGASSYQWQVDQGSGFVNLVNSGIYSGVNTRVLTATNLLTGTTGYRYRVFINGNSAQPAMVLRFMAYSNNGVFNNSGTWIGGVIPDSNTDVIVNDANLQINVNSNVRTMTVTQGATVQVLPGVRLTVHQ